MRDGMVNIGGTELYASSLGLSSGEGGWMRAEKGLGGKIVMVRNLTLDGGECLSSDGRTVYRVRFVGRGDCDEVRLWECDCPARRTCKHVTAISEISAAACAELGYD